MGFWWRNGVPYFFYKLARGEKKAGRAITIGCLKIKFYLASLCDFQAVFGPWNAGDIFHKLSKADSNQGMDRGIGRERKAVDSKTPVALG